MSSPVPSAYVTSKADSDRLARTYQKRGAPVVITYPSAVFGPHDPSLGRNAWMLRQFLCGQMPVAPDVTVPVIEVPVSLVDRVTARLDPLNKRLPGRGTGFDADLGWLLARLGPWHDQRTRIDFGIEPIPAETSVVATARWLAEADHLTRRQAGALLDREEVGVAASA